VITAFWHRRQGNGVQPAQTTQLAGGLAEAIEHHATHQGLDIELARAGAQGPAKGAVEAEILLQRVQREHIPKSPGGRVGDFELRGLVAPGHATKPPDQGIEVTGFHAIDAPEIGNDPVARLSGLVAVGLHDLQVSPTAALVDAHKHTCKICRDAQPCNAIDDDGV